MKTEAFFIHSAGSQKEHEGSDNLARYLRGALDKKYVLHHPLMPEPENPRYIPWKMTLQSTLPVGGNGIVLIGHSLGASVIVKYLSEGLCQAPVAGLFLIATPFWGKRGWSFDEFKFQKGFQSKLAGIEKIFIYHSRNDDWVPFSHAETYKSKLPGAVLRPLRGHQHEFNKGLPVLIKDINDLNT